MSASRAEVVVGAAGDEDVPRAGGFEPGDDGRPRKPAPPVTMTRLSVQ